MVVLCVALEDFMADFARLDEVFVFTWVDWSDGQTTPAEFQDVYTTNPPPGITPRNVQVVSVGEPDEEGLVEVRVKISVKDYIHGSMEYDMDPYDILSEIKKCAGDELAALASDYFKSADFKVTVIGVDEEGRLSADQRPSDPNL